MKLKEHQVKALNEMHNGCILNGGVGSGKSLTSLSYYYLLNGGSKTFLNGSKYVPMKNPKDLYIITPAKKRDKGEWDDEMLPFLMSSIPEENRYNNKIIVDSWNNIERYGDVKNAFFIFDEQRVVGYGTWAKTFIDIAKQNQWILLTATPGDTWTDYKAVFIANGFYRNQKEFEYEHCVFNRNLKYKKVDRYLNVRRLVRLRDKILITMQDQRHTVLHHENIFTKYNVLKYKTIQKTRWDPYNDIPIKSASELCTVLRKVVNEDESKQIELLELVAEKKRVIVFYNYDYERDILLNLCYLYDGKEVEVAEWNGHKHQEIPDSDAWVYLVQYTAGCEGWNCIKTDTIVFYSPNYSYKMMEQASGRINRMNTPFIDLYYYHFKTTSSIDLAIERALSQKKKFNEGKFAKF